MEILNNYEIFHPDYSVLLLLLTVAGTFLSIGAFFIFKTISKLMGIIVILVALFCWFGLFYELYNYKNWKVEELDVIVEDWNVIHEEGWEIIRTEGKITTIREKLNHE